MVKNAILSIAMVSLFFRNAGAVDSVQPWSSTLEAVGYAATAKASFARGCAKDHPLAETAAYLVICPKLNLIPSAVIEATALPYLQKHLTVAEARAAIDFYSSPIGRGLLPKILREIETGTYDQLSAEDLQNMEKANHTPFGQALKRFAMDQQAHVAVARAMLAYAP